MALRSKQWAPSCFAVRARPLPSPSQLPASDFASNHYALYCPKDVLVAVQDTHRITLVADTVDLSVLVAVTIVFQHLSELSSIPTYSSPLVNPETGLVAPPTVFDAVFEVLCTVLFAAELAPLAVLRTGFAEAAGALEG